MREKNRFHNPSTSKGAQDLAFPSINTSGNISGQKELADHPTTRVTRTSHLTSVHDAPARKPAEEPSVLPMTVPCPRKRVRSNAATSQDATVALSTARDRNSFKVQEDDFHDKK